LEDDLKKNLISPCNCSGNLKYVHRKCLDKWRLNSINKKNVFFCNICNFEYIIYQKKDIYFKIINKICYFICHPVYFYILSYIIYKLLAKSIYLNITYNIYNYFKPFIKYTSFSIFIKNFTYNLIFIINFNLLCKVKMLKDIIKNDFLRKNILLFKVYFNFLFILFVFSLLEMKYCALLFTVIVTQLNCIKSYGYIYINIDSLIYTILNKDELLN